MPPITVLIKPSSSNCNLRCRYCFYYDVAANREHSSFGFMTEETVSQVIQKALDFAEGECTFAFQGGEPTLIGLEFFKKVIALQQKYNSKQIRINNAIQTNGYHLTEQWAGFFHDNHFLVGLSLDGNKHTHNVNRVNAKGEGTFFDIMDTARLLEQYKVDYNILTVVNSSTAKKAGKIYEFYRKNNFHYLQFIPCLDPIGKVQGGEDYSLNGDDYGIFLKELFDLWFEDLQKGKQPYIRQFENYIAILLGQHPESCDQSGTCNYQFVVESDGEVYPCDFYVLDAYKLGNLNHITFEDIQKNRRDIGFIEYSLTDHEACKPCRYFPVCRGGCRRHREFGTSGNLPNSFCKAYQTFFEHCLDRMLYIAQVLSTQSRP